MEGSAPVTVSSGFTGAAPPPEPADSVPYADPLQVELAEYVVYAVAE